MSDAITVLNTKVRKRRRERIELLARAIAGNRKPTGAAIEVRALPPPAVNLAPTIHVDQPQPPDITVEAPRVEVDMSGVAESIRESLAGIIDRPLPAPIVNVSAPQVRVDGPPEIVVNVDTSPIAAVLERLAEAIEALALSRQRRWAVEYDRAGNIQAVVPK